MVDVYVFFGTLCVNYKTTLSAINTKIEKLYVQNNDQITRLDYVCVLRTIIDSVHFKILNAIRAQSPIPTHITMFCDFSFYWLRPILFGLFVDEILKLEYGALLFLCFHFFKYEFETRQNVCQTTIGLLKQMFPYFR